MDGRERNGWREEAEMGEKGNCGGRETWKMMSGKVKSEHLAAVKGEKETL